ncbi:enhanced serine sensitivity protein SseB C-terminal domain-containing protein [Ruminococcus sp. HUN007]|uniref:enhanced serine sensitivity protein SseB C-terminal domain-containing protein n=1 Tax=Ruminococcus sp. HUN007 TaxID=1514668 RepID=UPI0005D1BA8B|nr:enhanced serine sensitivity protein SseB C-terminal domain-containing protein [Ruminococcus sp. HUN007]
MSENTENKKIRLDEIENPALVYAMYEMKDKKTKETEAKFISELRRATFITPAVVEVKGEDGEFRVAEDSSQKGETRIQFMMLQNDKKERFLPAFTSMEEVRKWRKEDHFQTVICNFDQYINIVASDAEGPRGLAIDPYGSNILLSRELLEGLKSAIDERNNSQVFIADLKEHPEELEDALRDFFNEDGTVEQAYLQLMRRGNDVSYLLIVDNEFPENASEDEVKSIRKNLFDNIAEKIKPALNGRPLSIAGFSDEFGKKSG